MTPTQRAAMEQALMWIDAQPWPRMIGATTTLHALRAALAEQPAEPVPTKETYLQELLAFMNANNPSRWEIGFRNIVSILLGPKSSFEIADVVEMVRQLKQPAEQPQEPSAGGVLFAVEEAIRNGDCPWQIEQAFDDYEAKRKSINIKGDA